MTSLLDALPYDNVKFYCAYKAKDALDILGASI